MKFFPPSSGVGVKICGITSASQAEQIVSAGADAIGLNFWPKSKRWLPPNQADWARPLQQRVALVAVLVNPEPELLEQVTSAGLVNVLQFHGDEPPALIEAWMRKGFAVIKALQVRDEDSLSAIAGYPCRDILLDAYNPGLYGGEGRSFPWRLAALAAERYPDKRIILSGGLTPENVAEAILQTRPAAVDVASGVESSPGCKDMEKVRAFIQAARSIV
jgi:phosphoribosylanthranilate isomerase